MSEYTEKEQDLIDSYSVFSLWVLYAMATPSDNDIEFAKSYGLTVERYREIMTMLFKKRARENR